MPNVVWSRAYAGDRTSLAGEPGRRHSRNSKTLVFIGGGFGGRQPRWTATSRSPRPHGPPDYFRSVRPSLIRWAWIASRLFLSLPLTASWLVRRRDARSRAESAGGTA